MSDCPGLDTLLLGIDAGCRRVLDPLIERGAVPTIQQIFEDGIASCLTSQIPPWTASAWPSLYTGVNPGKHGTFDFLTFDGYDWQVVDATHVRELALWELIDHHGLSSVVVNVPVTHPTKPFDGALIPGYVAPENPTCHPSGILNDVAEGIGGYRIYPDIDKTASGQVKIQEYRTLVNMRGKAFQFLVDRFNPEFGFLQFQVTDTVLHEFPGDIDRAGEVYETVDSTISDVVETTQPSTIIMASDHGMDGYSSRFPVNEFLRNQGYVTAIRGGKRMPAWWDIREAQLRNGQPGNQTSATSDWNIIERLAAFASGMGLTAQRIGAILDQLGLTEFVKRRVPASMIQAASEQVDFENSIAYVRSRPECGVRINLAGREPNGIVSPSNYDEVRQSLMSTLKEASLPNGCPVFEDVGPREHYFTGPYLDHAPDIVTIPRDFDVYLTKWLDIDRLDAATQTGWDHTMEGIFAASGGRIDPDVDVSGAHLFDVAPTVLASLGLPPSDRMDGSPLGCVDPIEAQCYPEYNEDVSEGLDNQDIEDRLATLGYIE